MIDALRIVVLLTEAYGGSRQSSKFNVCFLSALDECEHVERIYARSCLAQEPIREKIPESVVYDRKAAGGKLAFMRRVASHAWRGGRVNLVVCEHLRLLLFAWLLARFWQARLGLLVNNAESWPPTKNLLAIWLIRSCDSFITTNSDVAQRFGIWSGIAMDRAFILPDCIDAKDVSGVEKLKARLGDWLWGV
jgi:hypothetical protein